MRASKASVRTLSSPFEQCAAGLLLLTLAAAAWGQTAAANGANPFGLVAFSSMSPGPPAPPWRVAGLPKQNKPFTHFEVVSVAGKSVLEVQSEHAYGNLVFDAPPGLRPVGLHLRWSWRLDRGLERSDLSSKAGDDTALKVCALFDMALDGLGLGERTLLRWARTISAEHLPAATLCYVWDRRLPVGTGLPNAFSARVRYVVVSSGDARPGQWIFLERDIAADFMHAFGHESAGLPPLLGIAVGADSDNTSGSSQGYVGDLSLAP